MNILRRIILSGLAMSISVGLWASDLRDLVEALPQETEHDKLKRSVLLVALEQQQTDEAEIRATAELPSETFSSKSASENASVLIQPRTVENNPYLRRLVAGAEKALQIPDKPWPRDDSDKPLFGDLNDLEYDPRRTAARMEAFFWLFSNPASPMKGNDEILSRLLRRAHTYVKSVLTENHTAGRNIYDDFALVPASTVLREFSALYPTLLLPSQRTSWERAMRVAGDKVMAHSHRQLSHHAKGYANIDAAISVQLLNFGLALNDQSMITRSQELMRRVADAILPDGGFHYIWSQNESSGYHDVVCQFIGRAYEITEDETYRKMLRRTQWYGPVSNGRLSEYWTAPAWKHTWNSGLKGIAGGEIVAAASGNPFVNGMIVRPGLEDLRRWENARSELPWYDGGLRSLDLPDRVTYPDRNIQGPRAWYGRFSYAATLRDIPSDEPGHATLIGALTTTEDHQIRAFVMGVFPRVRVGNDPTNPRSWAWLTTDMKASQVIGRHLSVSHASYELSTFNSSTVGKRSGWLATQLWLGLQDRIIGQIRVEPGPDAVSANDLEGIIRLGTGGTVNGNPEQIRDIGPRTWQYGDFVVRIWDRSFDHVEPRVVPFRLPAFPLTDLTLNAADVQSPASFLVEIRTTWASPAEEVVSDSDGSGFRITVGERRFHVVSNRSDEVRKFSLDGTTALVSGDDALQSKSIIEVPPGGCAVMIASPQTEDHQMGVEKFVDLVFTQ